ncbi:GNAT family N-acetyltransferase [Polaribacter gochangensis]|uniref:GNAT family N-acetyltransferase n=1 Tax=Polaribacter gochangensis TaxID=3252903 RepID=UPI003904CABC
MNIKITRTNSQNKDFINLIKELDAYLKITDGEDHDFYNQYNHIDVIKHVAVVYVDAIPVGCGAIKHFDAETVEVKRMFVDAKQRGLGIAPKILNELENWAKELGYKKCILETGERQVEAVKLYQKCNYKRMNINYGQYEGVVNSLCFEKNI